MNRRTFLKSIVTACGAAVVCPGELVKSKIKPGITTIGPYYISGGKWIPFPVHDHPVFVKARQQGCTNSILYGIPYWIGLSA
ncbi:hypothetical protein KAR91_87525 [Candidatus Pacearchaeota archaeon]|nr:hypothetical protein [Candidatus Pacearchaeota archaeon]